MRGSLDSQPVPAPVGSTPLREGRRVCASPNQPWAVAACRRSPVISGCAAFPAYPVLCATTRAAGRKALVARVLREKKGAVVNRLVDLTGKPVHLIAGQKINGLFRVGADCLALVGDVLPVFHRRQD